MPRCMECTVPIVKCEGGRWRMRTDAHLMVEVTPPRRMTSLCSVKGTIFARGYSRALAGSRKLVGLAWKKKLRPPGAYNKSQLSNIVLMSRLTHCSQVRKNARQEMKIAFSCPFRKVCKLLCLSALHKRIKE